MPVGIRPLGFIFNNSYIFPRINLCSVCLPQMLYGVTYANFGHLAGTGMYSYLHLRKFVHNRVPDIKGCYALYSLTL